MAYVFYAAILRALWANEVNAAAPKEEEDNTRGIGILDCKFHCFLPFLLEPVQDPR